jgi:anti-anti-sigma factor
MVVLAEPPESRLAADVEVADGTVVVRLSGDLDIPLRSALAEKLAVIAARNPGLLVIDLAGVTFLDGGTAAVIVKAAGLPSGRKPVLRSVRPIVRRLLEVTGLDGQCELSCDSSRRSSAG